uniref:Uncharacterized protein n=1 Tax=viral metagenome TaxID=1070528 RepID=A0A6M3LQB7_9ZZZZ
MITLERYKELKQKPYNKLTHEERREYSEGLKEYGKDIVQAHMKEAKGELPSQQVKPMTEETGIVDDQGAPDDKIVLKRSELQDMLKQMIEEREANQPKADEVPLNTWVSEGKKKDMQRTARLRLYQKDSDSPIGIVTGFKHHKWGQNPRTLEMNVDIYKVSLVYDDGTQEEIEMPYEEFSKMELKEEVKILKIDVAEKVMTQGYVNKPQQKNGYIVYGDRYPRTGERIPLEVKSADYTAHIERPNGQKLTLDIKYLNGC